MNTHYWRTRFTNEFGIHFSASELRFALAFIEEEIEKAVASYQTEYEQKHIASAVEIARWDERHKAYENIPNPNFSQNEVNRLCEEARKEERDKIVETCDSMWRKVNSEGDDGYNEALHRVKLYLTK